MRSPTIAACRATANCRSPSAPALDLALRIAVAQRDAALALDAMTVLAGSRIAQANHLLAERLVDADPGLAAQIRTYQDRTRAFQAADVALLRALASGQGVNLPALRARPRRRPRSRPAPR